MSKSRLQLPPTHKISKIQLPKLTIQTLANGIPVHVLNAGTQEVIRLELIFEAGRWYEKAKLIARTTAQLIKSGTADESAEQIADFFEFYGSALSIQEGFNHVVVELYCLVKHFERLIIKLSALLENPVFPQKELDNFKKIAREQLKLQLKKNDIVAYRLFTEQIFGSEHPYGYNSEIKDFDTVEREHLSEHYALNFKSSTCRIFISGKVSDRELQLLETSMGILNNENPPTQKKHALPSYSAQRKEARVSEKKLQASIRIGLPIFTYNHPDRSGFYMMNMILGGFFGSRLMQNLREKNGFTYGIYSAMEHLVEGGYWYIHSDVGMQYFEAALKEIYIEIDRMKNDRISIKELEMVKNYTLGMQLNLTDGVFNMASIHKQLILAGQTHKDFERFIDSIMNIKAQNIQDLAIKYLNTDQLTEIIVY